MRRPPFEPIEPAEPLSHVPRANPEPFSWLDIKLPNTIINIINFIYFLSRVIFMTT